MLTFELIESNSENKIYRAPIVGGWLVRCDCPAPHYATYNNEDRYTGNIVCEDRINYQSQLTFVHDFNHEWNGSSVIPDDTQFTATSRQYERRYGKPDTGHSLFTDSIPDSLIEQVQEQIDKDIIKNAKPITEINVGDRFLCIEDIYANGVGRTKLFTKGMESKSIEEGCILSFIGYQYILKGNEHRINEYFIKL